MSRPVLRPGFVGAPGFDPATPHLSVDGMTEHGPNLSHWPGNRTPARYKADLSTGICLRFAEAPADEQRAFLAGAELVVNDHYDTDGFLSMLAAIDPALALRHEDTCLLAAATGDFQAYHSRRGFAIDRIVANLAADGSPVAAEFAALTGPARSLARYRWLLDHVDLVLGEPEWFAGCWTDAWHHTTAELARCRAGALERDVDPYLGFAVVRTRGPVARMTLNTLGGAYRILHVDRHPDGVRYRYHDRTESWFEVVSFTPPPRIDLRPVATRLADLEPPLGPYAWHADPPTEPVPELWFGADTPQEYGEVTRELGPSRLRPDAVRELLAAAFAGAPR